MPVGWSIEGDIAFVPFFGCLGSSAITLCIDITGILGDWAGQPAHGKGTLWSMTVSDKAVIWLQWCRCDSELRSQEGETSVNDGSGGWGLSLRFQSLEKEYELLYFGKEAIQEVIRGQRQEEEIWDEQENGVRRLCVSLKHDAPALLWIGVSPRGWHRALLLPLADASRLDSPHTRSRWCA